VIFYLSSILRSKTVQIHDRVSRETKVAPWKTINKLLTNFVDQSFANTELAEDHIQNILHIDPAGQAAKGRSS
jgi:hypothetical protein